MTDSDHEASRPAFEAAHPWRNPMRNPARLYDDDETERDWRTWQAALDYAAREEPKWQPIETAPKDGTHVLLWDGSEFFIGWFSECDGEWNDANHGIVRFVQPDQWIPLPPVPDAGGA